MTSESCRHLGHRHRALGQPERRPGLVVQRIVSAYAEQKAIIGGAILGPIGAILALPAAAMVQSLEHFRPLINGYSGQRPDFYPAVVDAVRGFPSDDALVTLHDRGVQDGGTPGPGTIRADSPVARRRMRINWESRQVEATAE